jgi:hypothetical protein
LVAPSGRPAAPRHAQHGDEAVAFRDFCRELRVQRGGFCGVGFARQRRKDVNGLNLIWLTGSLMRSAREIQLMICDRVRSSLEAANKLVNATIARNPEKIDRVVNGGSPKEQLDADFPAPTGREAYARTERSGISAAAI